jgi:hypothetical protein
MQARMKNPGVVGARRPSDGTAGYHSETISSRALTSATHGSGREVSVSHKDVVPAGYGPAGSGRYGVGPRPAGTSPASAEVPMPPIISGCPRAHQMARPVRTNSIELGSVGWGLDRYDPPLP